MRPSTPTSQSWYLYDGSGQRVEQYVSGGSGNHTYYLPGGVEEVTPSGSLLKYYSAGGMLLGLNTAHDASGISYLASDGLGSVSFTWILSDALRLHAAIVYTRANNRRWLWHRTRIVRAIPLAESRWLVQTGVRVCGSSLASRARETQSTHVAA